MRSCSRAWASRSSADLVRALGAMLTWAFGPSRRFSPAACVAWSRRGDAVRDGGRPSGVPDRGVADADGADSAFCSSSSSSSPLKDSFPLTACFRFFFGGCGVETLCFDHQSLPFANLRILHPTNMMGIQSGNLPVTRGRRAGCRGGCSGGKAAKTSALGFALLLLERLGATFAEVG